MVGTQRSAVSHVARPSSSRLRASGASGLVAYCSAGSRKWNVAGLSGPRALTSRCTASSTCAKREEGNLRPEFADFIWVSLLRMFDICTGTVASRPVNTEPAFQAAPAGT